MTAFSTDSLFSFDVEKDGDSVLIHYGDDTLGVNPNTEDDGFSLTPDWNNHHFTLAISEGSVLYHLTPDGDNNKSRIGPESLAPSEFIAEVYAAIRTVARPLDIDEHDIDEVGDLSFDELRMYLTEKKVLVDSGSGVSVDEWMMNALIIDMTRRAELKFELFERVLTPVPVEEARRSGETFFVLPRAGEVYVLIMYPDGLVGCLHLEELLTLFDHMASGGKDRRGFGAGSMALSLLSMALSEE